MHAAAQAKVQRLQAAGDEFEKEILERAFSRARTQAVVPPVSAQITSTKGFIEREKKRLAAAEGSLRGCPESRRVHQSFGRGKEALRRIAVAGEEFCRTCPSTSGRVPRIGERSPNAHEAEDLSSGGHARVDSSGVVSLDGRSSGGRAGSSHPRRHSRVIELSSMLTNGGSRGAPREGRFALY